MAATSLRRIQKELTDFQKNPLPHVIVQSKDEDLTEWHLFMDGPRDTPYKGGRFTIIVKFGDQYPFKAPTFRFKTRIYHPNIDSDGNICIGLLKTENWKPATKISSVIQALYDLLQTPNPDDPLVTSIAELYRSDRKEYDKNAADYTAKYAK
ncbi:hypothetical protein NliqN6_6095 [Naganishia liquefaciens]|uniref:E2 ubiquitin-conjugating enzyme n=1 Tax=Naganishia liquefaciens TaxID=104408 RepID=A0A8H3YHT9_9TREE|nr:hypothetical protein NliqN6_6095 [Naganishia liquefaciens]